MPKRLLSFDPVTGLKTFHEYDHDERETTISYEQDVEGLLDYNKEIQKADLTSYKRKRDIWHAAQIPEGIILKWRSEEGIDVYNPQHWERIRKKLNDPDWKYLRTWQGRV